MEWKSICLLAVESKRDTKSHHVTNHTIIGDSVGGDDCSLFAIPFLFAYRQCELLELDCVTRDQQSTTSQSSSSWWNGLCYAMGDRL